MFVYIVSSSQMLYVKCLCVLSRYLRCYMLNVCVYFLVILDVICQMFVCVVSLYQMLYVKCLCVLSRYLKCYMVMFVCVVSLSQMLCVKCLSVLSRYLRCYMLNVCVYCLVISDVIC